MGARELSTMNNYDIIKKLTNSDIKELKSTFKNQLLYPTMGKGGKQLLYQFRSWQRLQKLNLGLIKGKFEPESFQLTEQGKELVKEL